MVHQLLASKLQKVSTTSMFNVRHVNLVSLMEHLTRFNEATIKVIHPNQEMLVGPFENGLRARHFNEPFAPKFVVSMNEIKACDECYIKG